MREQKIKELLHKINKEYQEGAENYKMRMYYESEYKKAQLEIDSLRKERLRLKQQVLELTEFKQRFSGFGPLGMGEVMSLYTEVNSNVDKYNKDLERRK